MSIVTCQLDRVLGAALALRHWLKRWLEHFNAGDVQKGTNDNAVGVRIANRYSRLGQKGITGIANSMSDAAGKMDRERHKRTCIEETLKILLVHGATDLAKRECEKKNRGGEIRTRDFLVPNQAR
jgi:hypothetical protein